MSKKRLTYEVYKDGLPVTRGTTEELADYFHVTRGTIGNYERTGRKLHKDYSIERLQEEENGRARKVYAYQSDG